MLDTWRRATEEYKVPGDAMVSFTLKLEENLLRLAVFVNTWRN